MPDTFFLFTQGFLKVVVSMSSERESKAILHGIAISTIYLEIIPDEKVVRWHIFPNLLEKQKVGVQEWPAGVFCIQPSIVKQDSLWELLIKEMHTKIFAMSFCSFVFLFLFSDKSNTVKTTFKWKLYMKNSLYIYIYTHSDAFFLPNESSFCLKERVFQEGRHS